MNLTTITKIAADFKLEASYVKELMSAAKPAASTPYGRGQMHFYNQEDVDAVIKPVLAELERKRASAQAARDAKKRKAEQQAEEAVVPLATPPAAPAKDEDLHKKVDTLAAGIDALLEKVAELSTQNGLLLKAIEKVPSLVMGPMTIGSKTPTPGELDELLERLATRNGTEIDKPLVADVKVPEKVRRAKVLIVTNTNHHGPVLKDFGKEMDIVFHPTEKARGLTPSSIKGYDRVFLMLDFMNHGVPLTSGMDNVKTVKGGVSTLKTELTAYYLQFTGEGIRA